MNCERKAEVHPRGADEQQQEGRAPARIEEPARQQKQAFSRREGRQQPVIRNQDHPDEHEERETVEEHRSWGSEVVARCERVWLPSGASGRNAAAEEKILLVPSRITTQPLHVSELT